VAARFGGLARPIGVVLLVLLWIVALQLLWLVWIADVLTALVARRSEFAADAGAVEFGYGPALLDAYETLAQPEQPKSRLERLTDFHPPMSERVERVRGQLGRRALPAPA
jgi:Zn-dependent protease with chaperone function